MDLAKFDTVAASEEGIFVQLQANGQMLVTDPPPPAEGEEAEKPQPIGITIYGLDSKQVRAARHRIDNKNRRSLRVKRGGRVETNTTAEESDEADIEVLAAACKQFHNIVLDKEPLRCTPDNANKLFTRLPWVRRQIEDALYDEEELLGEASKRS